MGEHSLEDSFRHGGESPSDLCLVRPMDCDPQHDQRQAREIDNVWHLPQDNYADDRSGRGQQSQEQSKAGARQSRHSQLVTNVGDDRGADANPDAGKYQYRCTESIKCIRKADRNYTEERQCHRSAQSFYALRCPALCNLVSEYDVKNKKAAVQKCPDKAEPIRGPFATADAEDPRYVNEQGDSEDSRDEREPVSTSPGSPKRNSDHADEFYRCDERDG